MAREYAFENNITEGKVQIIRELSIDFNKISILFENAYSAKKKRLNFSRVMELSMVADDLDDYREDIDLMAYRTLIGFDYDLVDNRYVYCIKIDDYEIIIKSLDFVTLIDNA